MTFPSGPPETTTNAEADPKTSARNRIRTSVLVGLCCFVIYNANGRAISAGDTYPARYLPFAILQYHTVFMNPIASVAAQGRGDTAFWILHRPDGRMVSLYPVVVPVLVAPLYIPAVAYLHVRGWTDARLDFVARVMEKLSASLLAGLSASLLYLVLRRRTTNRNALLLTIAYALGTTTWVISSQALWQHGLAELLVIAVMLLLTGPYTTPRAIAAALLCGLIACNRPPDVLLAGALGVYALFWAGRRRAVMLAAVAALPALVVLSYNLRIGENVAGGYGIAGRGHFFEHGLLEGLAGLLVSPTRGLFVFSPFLLFVLLAWRHLPRGREERILTLALSAGVVLQLLLYAKVDWRGGMSWGPRYMTDLLPFLVWLLVPVVDALRGAARACFHAAVGLSIVIQAIGAFMYTGSLDIAINAAHHGPDEMKAMWNWRNSAIFMAPKQGLAPRELWIEMRGALDAIESGGRPASEIIAGQEAVATGWALAGDATPWQVAVTIDGQQTFGTNTFTDRPDVRASLGETSPAGWRIPLDTSRLEPGEHRLSVLVWASPEGDAHYIGDRTIQVGTAPSTAATGERDLEESLAKAVAQLRVHQQPDGSWLTSYTNGTRFDDARPEMNTFLTSLLVDLLDPVAKDSGLEANVRRARAHLTAQIERGGLVRYHGRPDGPGIGTLGCVITPDTDDTALVWRIAPSADGAQRTAALTTIERYKTPEGLYRSWLAPRERYECLDPGSDPNPTDVAIQMHMLLLLSEVRPEAGRALCAALRRAIDEDRIWVYYRRTPLVPMLRTGDLDRAGCALQLPESRMRTEVPGQSIWLTVARLLDPATTADPVLIRAVLRELARDDFALVRTNPPLLYHNDLTATVSRYYWSADAGYSLWLRLHDRFTRESDHHPLQ